MNLGTRQSAAVFIVYRNVEAPMKAIALTIMTAAMLSSGAAQAQPGTTRLDHDVQKMWDDVFNPRVDGTDRTNWERRRDAERREWCRANTGYSRCSVYR